MEIVNKKVEDLIPYINNSRTHNEEQVKQICASINEFGFTNPLLIDEKDNIIAGHGRLLASKKLNMEEVPCIVLSGLTEAQKKAYIIADNKLALNAGWDDELLKLELENLKELDFDISLTGFNIDELDDVLGEEKEVEEDDFDCTPPEEPKAKLGDIYQLGNHRLMCGDSTNKSNIEKLLDGNKVDLLFTDPPYNMHYSGRGIIPENERVQTMVDFDANSINWLSNTDFGSMYIFTSKDLIPDYLKIFKDWKFNILIWEKTNNPPLTMNTFLPDIEYLLYFHNGNRIWNNSLKPMEIYKKVYSSSRQEGQKEIGNVHPTMKPINLICDKLKISSNENSLVLDLFGGSGSTLIACEQLNRNCYMMELSPEYVDVIINRWETFTGKKAVLLNE